MTVDPALVEAISQRASREGLTESLIQALRRDHPGVHFTLCADDDIHGARPVAGGEGFQVYLVDGSNHCSSLTGDYQVATGLVLAQQEDD